MLNSFLRLYNAQHAFSVPDNTTFSVKPVTIDWQEGDGMDMEQYKDKTYDKVKGANWIVARSGSSGAGIGTAATATVKFNSATAADYDDETFTVTSADETTVVYTLNDDSTDNSYGASTTSIGIQGAPAASKVSELVTAAGNNSDNAHYNKITFVEGSSATVTLTQDTAGTAGNNTITTTDATDITVSGFTGGTDLAKWTTEGGDYSSSNNGSMSFVDGTEDLEVDITTLVEGWIDESINNYGVGVHITSAEEAAKKTRYTKKFFARTTQYFFKRPIIEARWDSTEKDERGNFYAKSNLLGNTENNNTIYFKNYFNGVLTDVNGDPGLKTRIYSDSVKSYELTNLAADGYFTATAASPGVYKDGR